MVGAGDLKEIITVLREGRTQDEIGGWVIAWQSLGSFHAQITPMKGQMQDHAGQTETPRYYRITLRKSSRSTAITANDRIKWRERVMRIEFIAENGATPLFLMLEAEEAVHYAEEGMP
jgi:SPP1 family predicted phage head-tail adaptor